MNIAFFIPSLINKGGVERATTSLINGLANNLKENCSIYLIVFDDNEFAFEIDSRVKIISLNIKNYRTEIIHINIKLFNTIRRHNITSFICVETMSLLFCLLPLKIMRKKTKLIVWEHFNFRNNNGKKTRSLLRRIAAQYADLIILLTKRDVEEWNKNYNIKSKITFIYNISTFNRESNPYNNKSRKILAVGRYTQVKGFDRLIEIWQRLQSRYNVSEWELDIVGYGEEKPHLESLIQNLKVSNINLVDGTNVANHYANAGFYCMTSYYEGLPMVLIEAQSFGLPSIAFDIFTGPSEIISQSSGILVKDNDYDAFINAMYKMINDSSFRLRMSRSAFENSKNFSEEIISIRWIEVLDKIHN